MLAGLIFGGAYGAPRGLWGCARHDVLGRGGWEERRTAYGKGNRPNRCAPCVGTSNESIPLLILKP